MQGRLRGVRKKRFALVEEEDGIGQALGEAHVVSDHDAGEAELLLEALDEYLRGGGQ